MAENLETLQKIGLTKAEAKTYLSLLYLKESKTGQLCEKTNIPSSNIYPILDSLIKKGLVSYKIQNNIKIFLPSDPLILDKIFEERQKNIEKDRLEIKNLVSNLETQKNLPFSMSNYKYYEGLRGIKSIWFELIKELDNFPKNSEIKTYATMPEAYESLISIYDEFHKKRIKRKIGYKLILSNKDYEYGEKRKKSKFTKVKYLELKNEGSIIVFPTGLILQYVTTQNPRAFLIKDDIFVKTFNQIFDQLWEKNNNFLI